MGIDGSISDARIFNWLVFFSKVKLYLQTFEVAHIIKVPKIISTNNITFGIPNIVNYHLQQRLLNHPSAHGLHLIFHQQ